VDNITGLYFENAILNYLIRFWFQRSTQYYRSETVVEQEGQKVGSSGFWHFKIKNKLKVIVFMCQAVMVRSADDRSVLGFCNRKTSWTVRGRTHMEGRGFQIITSVSLSCFAKERCIPWNINFRLLDVYPQICGHTTVIQNESTMLSHFHRNTVSRLWGHSVSQFSSCRLIKIPPERPPLVDEISANFCGYWVSRGQRNGSPRSLIRFSWPEPLLFHSSSSSIILTRLSGPRSRPTTSQKIWWVRLRTKRPRSLV
jgi:hypothetical protein